MLDAPDVTTGGLPIPSQKFLHTICCSSCGTVLSRSYGGTESYVRCPKCQADLYYTVDDNGPTIRIIKQPKHLPIPPAMPG